MIHFIGVCGATAGAFLVQCSPGLGILGIGLEVMGLLLLSLPTYLLLSSLHFLFFVRSEAGSREYTATEVSAGLVIILSCVLSAISGGEEGKLTEIDVLRQINSNYWMWAMIILWVLLSVRKITGFGSIVAVECLIPGLMATIGICGIKLSGQLFQLFLTGHNFHVELFCATCIIGTSLIAAAASFYKVLLNKYERVTVAATVYLWVVGIGFGLVALVLNSGLNPSAVNYFSSLVSFALVCSAVVAVLFQKIPFTLEFESIKQEDEDCEFDLKTSVFENDHDSEEIDEESLIKNIHNLI